jgi:hypothetical protein
MDKPRMFWWMDTPRIFETMIENNQWCILRLVSRLMGKPRMVWLIDKPNMTEIQYREI